MYERKRRSILKAISWRIIGTLDTFLISFLITGKFKFAISISGIELLTKFSHYTLMDSSCVTPPPHPYKPDRVISTLSTILVPLIRITGEGGL